MNRTSKIRQTHNEELESACASNNVSFNSMKILLEAEKTKKILKRNAQIFQSIDKEIDKALDNESR